VTHDKRHPERINYQRAEKKEEGNVALAAVPDHREGGHRDPHIICWNCNQAWTCSYWLSEGHARLSPNHINGYNHPKPLAKHVRGTANATVFWKMRRVRAFGSVKRQS